MKKQFSLLALAALCLAAAGCSSTPDEEDYPSFSIAYSPIIRTSQVRAEIIRSATARGWSLVQEAPGVIEFTLRNQHIRATYGDTHVTLAQIRGSKDVSRVLYQIQAELAGVLPRPITAIPAPQ